MGKNKMKKMKLLSTLLVFSIFCFITAVPSAEAVPMPGAIFTTDNACNGTNINIFSDKDAVYLDGGPAHTGAAGLPDGNYYIKVTEPNGTLLGYSTADSVQVSGGEFVQCYQLSAILVYPNGITPGYDTTNNPGGEYKVWASTDSTFPGSASKTDNFKVESNGGSGGGDPETATLNVNKFYDANANGMNDDNQLITGWKVRIQDNIDYIRYTPVTIIVDPDDYTVTEFFPLEPNWVLTTSNPVLITLLNGDNETIEFGNVCLGQGGGKTLGFWSNKNGQALIGPDDLAMLRGLYLVNGGPFDPTSKSAVKTWLLSANATNMAYMLSAQLAAMELNVFNGLVSGSALVYAPGLLPFTPVTGLNSLGFISITNLMAAANTELGTHVTAYSGDGWRSYQEALKNVLDSANNNYNFVQSTPCPFTFAE
jgi:hypothetical protein